MSERPAFSVQSRLKSFVYAFRGIAYLARSEHNAWLHIVATAAAVGAGALFGISAEDWRWIGLAITLVWMGEAFNTAIERLCDVVSPDFDVRIGQVKHVAAAGVLIAAFFALLIGLAIFGPYVWVEAGFRH